LNILSSARSGMALATFFTVPFCRAWISTLDAKLARARG
jgi:hypothetical protein